MFLKYPNEKIRISCSFRVKGYADMMVKKCVTSQLMYIYNFSGDPSQVTHVTMTSQVQHCFGYCPLHFPWQFSPFIQIHAIQPSLMNEKYKQKCQKAFGFVTDNARSPCKQCLFNASHVTEDYSPTNLVTLVSTLKLVVIPKTPKMVINASAWHSALKRWIRDKVLQ